MTIFATHELAPDAGPDTLHIVYNPLNCYEVTIPTDPTGVYYDSVRFVWQTGTGQDKNQYSIHSCLVAGPGSSDAAFDEYMNTASSRASIQPIPQQVSRLLYDKDETRRFEAETLAKDSFFSSSKNATGKTLIRASQYGPDLCGPGWRADVPDVEVAFTGETVELEGLHVGPMCVSAKDGKKRMSFHATMNSLKETSPEQQARAEERLCGWAKLQGAPHSTTQDGVYERYQSMATLATAMSSLKKYLAAPSMGGVPADDNGSAGEV